MAQRRHHYEQAFEHLLRERQIPYIAVDEAKKALMPASAPLRAGTRSLKSFDFVIYGDPNTRGPSGAPRAALEADGAAREVASEVASAGASGGGGGGGGALVEIKGRRVRTPARAKPGSPGRLESWVTEEDVRSLLLWSGLFGSRFVPAIVFVYWLDAPPTSVLYEDVWSHRDRWYAARAVRADRYVQHMTPRSVRWGTVHLPRRTFDELSMRVVPSPSEGNWVDPSESSGLSAPPGWLVAPFRGSAGVSAS